MWTPGGHNELTDNTELIIPTERIVIPERWQANLGAVRWPHFPTNAPCLLQGSP